MGLETVHPDVLPRLNKRMTLDDFERAAGFLRRTRRRRAGVHPAAAAVPRRRRGRRVGQAIARLRLRRWASSAASVIPTRAGNGAMERLQDGRAVRAAAPGIAGGGAGVRRRPAARPRLRRLVGHRKVVSLPALRPGPRRRLDAMNREQAVPPPVLCDCGGGTMIRERADVAILGAASPAASWRWCCGGSAAACVLLERGDHPRFAVGESSTPLANLVLESLGREYDLPRLAPLAEYGRWQRAYPHLACGLKRGFTFFRHEPGRRSAAARPRQRIARRRQPGRRRGRHALVPRALRPFPPHGGPVARGVLPRPHGDRGDRRAGRATGGSPAGARMSLSK